MFEKNHKTFIFTEKTSGRILVVKKSREFDFLIEGKDWLCYGILSDALCVIPSSSDYSWDPIQGLKQQEPLGTKDQDRFKLLRRKIEILISLWANLRVVSGKARTKISNRRIGKLPIQSKNFSKLWNLIIHERAILRRRKRDSCLSFRKRIESAETLEALEKEYNFLVLNVTIGGYAISSRDVGGRRVKNNHAK